MKKLPRHLLIHFFFAMLSAGVFLFSRMVPLPLAPIENPWTLGQEFIQSIQFREFQMHVKEKKVMKSQSFQIEIERFPDAALDPPASRYAIRIRPVVILPIPESSVGLELGLVDVNPGASQGDLRLVAVRKLNPLENVKP